MAKILTGPLAAGLSGGLGPVVFHQTKFGQVVQSKAKAKRHTTPAALTTKAQFAAASKGATRIGQWFRPVLNVRIHNRAEPAQAWLVQALLASQRLQNPRPYTTTRASWWWSFDAPFYTAGRWTIHYNNHNGSLLQPALASIFFDAAGAYQGAGFAANLAGRNIALSLTPQSWTHYVIVPGFRETTWRNGPPFSDDPSPAPLSLYVPGV